MAYFKVLIGEWNAMEKEREDLERRYELLRQEVKTLQRAHDIHYGAIGGKCPLCGRQWRD